MLLKAKELMSNDEPVGVEMPLGKTVAEFTAVQSANELKFSVVSAPTAAVHAARSVYTTTAAVAWLQERKAVAATDKEAIVRLMLALSMNLTTNLLALWNFLYSVDR